MHSSFPIPLSQGVKVNPVVGEYIEKYASSCRRTLSHQVRHVSTTHFNNLIDTLFWETHYLVSISNTYLKLTAIKCDNGYYERNEDEDELYYELEDQQVYQLSVTEQLIGVRTECSVNIYELVQDEEHTNRQIVLKKVFNNKQTPIIKFAFVSNGSFFTIDADMVLKMYSIKHKKAVKKAILTDVAAVDIDPIDENRIYILTNRAIYLYKFHDSDGEEINCLQEIFNPRRFKPFLRFCVSKLSSDVVYVICCTAVLMVDCKIGSMKPKAALVKTAEFSPNWMPSFVSSIVHHSSEYLCVGTLNSDKPIVIYHSDFCEESYLKIHELTVVNSALLNDVKMLGKCLNFLSDAEDRFLRVNCGVKIVGRNAKDSKVVLCVFTMNSLGDVFHQYVAKKAKHLPFGDRYAAERLDDWDEAIIHHQVHKIKFDKIDGQKNVGLLRRLMIYDLPLQTVAPNGIIPEANYSFN